MRQNSANAAVSRNTGISLSLRLGLPRRCHPGPSPVPSAVVGLYLLALQRFQVGGECSFFFIASAKSAKCARCRSRISSASRFPSTCPARTGDGLQHAGSGLPRPSFVLVSTRDLFTRLASAFQARRSQLPARTGTVPRRLPASSRAED